MCGADSGTELEQQQSIPMINRGAENCPETNTTSNLLVCLLLLACLRVMFLLMSKQEDHSCRSTDSSLNNRWLYKVLKRKSSRDDSNNQEHLLLAVSFRAETHPRSNLEMKPDKIHSSSDRYSISGQHVTQSRIPLPCQGETHPGHSKVLSLVCTCSKGPDICSCLLAAWERGARQISISLKPQNVHESLGFRSHDASADL